MIEDLLSRLLYFIQTTLEIFLPLLPWLTGAALLAAWLERRHFERLQPSHPLSGALLGLLSPLPTIAAIPLLRSESRGSAAFLSSSLLLNPVLLFLITANLGWQPALVYLLLVLLISLSFGVIVHLKAPPQEAAKPVTVESLLRRAWKHLCFIGFYTLIGAFIAALMRNWISWTAYNLKIVETMNNIPGFICLKILFLAVAIPGYMCGGAWLPVLGEMNSLGFTSGFVLAFILLGQATRPAHLGALQTVFSVKALAGFLAIIGIFSLLLFFFF